jgi:hypothetical protein
MHEKEQEKEGADEEIDSATGKAVSSWGLA